MESITMQAFEELITIETNSINLIDVREREAFDLVHIKGANNIPLEKLEQKVKELDQEQVYYLICYSGSFSMIASQILRENGFKAINVESGMNGYQGPTV